MIYVDNHYISNTYNWKVTGIRTDKFYRSNKHNCIIYRATGTLINDEPTNLIQPDNIEIYSSLIPHPYSLILSWTSMYCLSASRSNEKRN